MNKDKRLAIILAPFLLVGGYVLSDLYVESKANKEQFFKLEVSENCDIFKADCILKSGDMKVNFTDRNGITKANTSFPVDSVAISLVYTTGEKEIIYGLEKIDKNPQYWERETDIRKAFNKQISTHLRTVIKRKGSTYFGEFSPVSLNK